MDVKYFRPRKPGPEVKLEDAVVKQASLLFPNDSPTSWMAGSLPLGSSMPDLVIITYDPQISILSSLEMPDAYILSYLRSVSRARINTISNRIRGPQEKILQCLEVLVKAKAVLSNSSTYSLSPSWREILLEIITIEAKVKNWKSAVDQAVRNRAFAYRSYVALPDKIATRVKKETVFSRFGIGLLAVEDNDDVNIVRRARRHQPRIWTYYYQLAFHSANHFREADKCHSLSL